MDDLIEALEIFKRYQSGYNLEYPTHCQHYELWVCGVDVGDLTKDEIQKLDKIGFFWDSDDEAFKSYKFGSC